MKTTNYFFKIVRLALIIILALCLAGFCILVIFQGDSSEVELTALLVPASIVLGILLGCVIGMNIIKRRIVSSLNAEVRIAAQGQTVISGTFVLATEGLKLRGVAIANASCHVETPPTEINRTDCTLVLGDPRLLK